MTESVNLKQKNVKNKDEFKCDVCGLGCNSQKQLDIHLMSRKHEEKEKEKRVDGEEMPKCKFFTF